jgi:hypothetical protein
MVGHDSDILFQATVKDRMMMPMLIWKIWQLCNVIVQGKSVPSMDSTWSFLCSHLVSPLHPKQCDSRVPYF